MYVELAARSNFSFLSGGSHPEELVAQAAALGHSAIGIADSHSLAGVVRAHLTAREHGIKLVVGSRLTLEDGLTCLVYPTDRAAYGRLCRLLTKGKLAAPKGECQLVEDDLLSAAEGQLLLFAPPDALGADAAANLSAKLSMFREAFPDQVYLFTRNLLLGDDAHHIEQCDRIARRARVRLLACNEVLMHDAHRAPLVDVLACLREKMSIDRMGTRALKNAERCLKRESDMQRLFAGYADAVHASGEVAERVQFSLDQLRFDYPSETRSAGESAIKRLRSATEQGLRRRFPDAPPERVRAQVAKELNIIEKLGVAPYFLTVYDLVQFARSRDILCQGRGSAANSSVCYALGITEVNPAEADLVFERFVSEARDEPPDIDVDFEHERREEVIQHVYDAYGRHRAALTATVISFRSRLALREVGKALGFSGDTFGRLAERVWSSRGKAPSDEIVREIGLDPDSPKLRFALELVETLIGFPRHLSQHPGGFVMSEGRLDEIAPIGNAAMPDRTVIEWDKNDLDALGILKVDVLGLGMLSCLRKSFDLLQRHKGREMSIATLPQDDARVYEMLGDADSVGVFQVESRAQMSFLPRMKPRCFYDLVIEVAIVRPGPIQGDMVHPYLRRRNGEEPVDYPSEALRGVLERTLGVPLFQEQAMQLAMTGAGFSAREADQLRRSMAAFRRLGTLGQFEARFLAGMCGRGYQLDFAKRCWKQIEGFGDYGFPESHAASFALLVYASAWLKRHHPDVFACALLNSQPMGFYAPAQIVADARRHGVEVRSVDINASEWDCTLEPCAGDHDALRLGLRMVKGLGEGDAIALLAARGNGYVSVQDLKRLSGVGDGAVNALADASAFESVGFTRREAVWEALAPQASLGPLFDEPEAPVCVPFSGAASVCVPFLPAACLGEDVAMDYTATGLSLRAHPMAVLREQLTGCVRAEHLPARRDGDFVAVAGLVITRQRPATAKGVIFITLEDETGSANMVVWEHIFERFRAAVMTGRLLRVTGRLQIEGKVIHLVAGRIEDCSSVLDGLAGDDAGFNRSTASDRHPRHIAKRVFRSRDFH